MSDEEFKAKCLLLDIEIEQLGAISGRWIIWNGSHRDKRDWRLLSKTKPPVRLVSFNSREDALKAFINNKGKYIWD